MFYVVPRNTNLIECCKHSHNPVPAMFDTLADAKNHADSLHDRLGNHWQVLKVEAVWTTTTLADLLAEDPAHRAMIRR